MSKYVPPSKRSAIKKEITSLGQEHFPVLANAVVKTSRLNFLQHVKEGEEERMRREREAAGYDPTKVSMLTKLQLEQEGWALLSLKGVRTAAELSQWHERVFYEEPEVHANESVVAEKASVIYDDLTDYEESDCDSVCE